MFRKNCPIDIEQREGRIIRFGNENKDVRIYKYIQEKSFDSYMWQMLARKAEFIAQAMSEGNLANEMDEIDDFVLSAKEIMALATGNPLILEKVTIDEDVKRLLTLKRSYNNNLYDMQDRIAKLPSRIDTYKKREEQVRKDIANAPDTKTMVLTISKKNFDKKEMAEALANAINKISKFETALHVGNIGAFELWATKKLVGARTLSIRGEGEYVIELGESGDGNITRIANQFNKLNDELARLQGLVESAQKELESIQEDIGTPFRYQAELDEKLKKQAEVDLQLMGPDGGKKDMSDIIAEDMKDSFKTEDELLEEESQNVAEVEPVDYSIGLNGEEVKTREFEVGLSEFSEAVLKPKGISLAWFSDGENLRGLPDSYSLSEQIDDWLMGKMPSSGVFELGKTPLVLQKLGAKDLKLTMAQEVLAKVTGEKHSIALDDIKSLPQAISEPIMVFQSATVPNAFVVLTELEDKAGENVVVAIHLNRFENKIQINRIASVYGKQGAENFVNTQINLGNLKYVDNKKSQTWSDRRGLQLPKPTQSISGSNNSILTREDIVNSILPESDKNNAFSLEQTPTINAYYNKETKTIHLNRNAKKPHMVLLGHELYHAMPLEEQARIALFFRSKAKTQTEAFVAYKKRMMASYQAMYDKNGMGEFTEADFWKEFAAENCETLFTNEDFVKQLVGKRPSLGRRILDFIRRMWNRLLSRSPYTNSIGTQAAGLTAQTLAEAEKMYANALNVSSWDLDADVAKKAFAEGDEAERFADLMGFGEERPQSNVPLIDFSVSTEDLSEERLKEIDELFQNSKIGVSKTPVKEILSDVRKEVQHKITRVFPDIPERGEKGMFFAEFRKNMIQWKNLGQIASFHTQNKLDNITKGLTPAEFKTFEQMVYYKDLAEEAKIQEENGYEEILLPNGLSVSDVTAKLAQLEKEKNDNVQEALNRRKKTMDDMTKRYVEVNKAIGFDVSDKFSRSDYFRHEVIAHMNDKYRSGGGTRHMTANDKRGWLKGRKGSTEAINTDYLVVEFKNMLEKEYDTAIAETLLAIKQKYDIKPQLEKEAFANNKDLMNELIEKEAIKNGKNGEIAMVMQKGKLVPDSELFRQQQAFNDKIMYGFKGLMGLAQDGLLDDFGGVFSDVVETLRKGSLNSPSLYKYISAIVNAEYDEKTATPAQHQARISALTVLKYKSQKTAFIREKLGKQYQTWESLAREKSDTHEIIQPRRGNFMFRQQVVAEDAFNDAFNKLLGSMVSGEMVGMDTDVKKLFEEYGETIKMIGAAYEQWVLPNEIVSTMDLVVNDRIKGLGINIFRGATSAWKGWVTTLNPLRTVKYGIRNIVGDLDPVIAGKPQVLLYSKQAIKEIYQAMKNGTYTESFAEWADRGGYSAMLFANEMDPALREKMFSYLQEKQGKGILSIPASLLKGYVGAVETVHNFREAILRYSAYLYFKDSIAKNNGKVVDYVASNKYIVNGLATLEDKAYQLSKDLLGAYDEVKYTGQVVRRYFMPFFSFTETNTLRYLRMVENALTTGSVPHRAQKTMLLALRSPLIWLLITAWNKLVMGDEEEKLPASVRARPHLTLGGNGEDVYAFTRLGSLSEILEWVGLDDLQWTKDDLTAPLDKTFGMISPFFKTPVELASGLTFYPELTKPSAIRDRGEYLFNSLGAVDIYKAATGKPTRGLGNTLENALLYKYDVEESAYFEILDRKREFQKSNDSTIYKADDKSNALYYMKQAMRYEDKEAALKYLDSYFENGGTVKGITQSFAMLNPMYGFTSAQTMEKGKAFVASLTENEREKLRIAQSYYEHDLGLPDNVLALLKKDGVTNEGAKNVLKKYINSKLQ